MARVKPSKSTKQKDPRPAKQKSGPVSALGLDYSTKDIRNFVKGIISFIFVVGSALVTWNFGKVLTNTESPIVVVLTGSMEPAFFRGDLLLVTHWAEDMEAGDIIVYSLPGQDIPIVHRAVLVQEIDDGLPSDKIPVRLLDKGMLFYFSLCTGLGEFYA